jgi:hypothetical protein
LLANGTVPSRRAPRLFAISFLVNESRACLACPCLLSPPCRAVPLLPNPRRVAPNHRPATPPRLAAAASAAAPAAPRRAGSRRREAIGDPGLRGGDRPSALPPRAAEPRLLPPARSWPASRLPRADSLQYTGCATDDTWCVACLLLTCPRSAFPVTFCSVFVLHTSDAMCRVAVLSTSAAVISPCFGRVWGEDFAWFWSSCSGVTGESEVEQFASCGIS